MCMAITTNKHRELRFSHSQSVFLCLPRIPLPTWPMNKTGAFNIAVRGSRQNELETSTDTVCSASKFQGLGWGKVGVLCRPISPPCECPHTSKQPSIPPASNCKTGSQS